MMSRRLVLLVCLLFLFLESAFCDHDANAVGTRTTNAFSSTFSDFMSNWFSSDHPAEVDDNNEQTNEKNEETLKKVLSNIINTTNSTEQGNKNFQDTPMTSSEAKTGDETKVMTSSIPTYSTTTKNSYSTSSSVSSTYFAETHSTSYWPTSTQRFAPPQEEQRCYTDAVLQNFCSVPNEMTDVSFWDLYSVLFLDTVLDALMIGCSRGLWCLQDRFDYWDALMAERVDMVMESEISATMCQSDLSSCITKTVQNFRNCSMYPQMEFTTESLSLICKLKQNQALPDTCFKHVITALHVSLADIMRSKEDYNLQSDDTCDSPEAYMTGGLICVENSCPGESETFNSFAPWAWFTSVVINLIEECDMDSTKCQALLQRGPGYLYNSEIGTMIGASIATTVSALLLTITMCVCYKRYRRNAVIKDGYQKLLNDGDES